MSSQRELDLHVGKKLREKRQKLGLTLTYVAEKLSLSHQQIQKYEQAQSRISAAILYNIGGLYGVPMHYFFEGFNDSVTEMPYKSGIIEQNRSKILNILLVEDDPADELLIRQACDEIKDRVNIFCVHDGLQSIEFLRYKTMNVNFPRPDIILLDLNIPKKDGYETLRDIKRDREIQDIPVIVLTNSINIKDMIRMYQNYAAGYINKSFDFDVFLKTFRILVDYWSWAVVLPGTAKREPVKKEAVV
ncbi:MAG: response regulator [Alphaproteobacteria bacterium]